MQSFSSRSYAHKMLNCYGTVGEFFYVSSDVSGNSIRHNFRSGNDAELIIFELNQKLF